jgi:hypothetical protein
MADFEIADPKYVFRGLTYGQWVAVWSNQLFSEKPDIVYREGKSVAFLRGNVEYAYQKQEDPEKEIFSLLTQEYKIRILEDTAIFVPVISTMFVLGDEYQGQVMNDELSMRITARRDTVNGGEVGVQIRKKPENNAHKLVNNLNEYYVESSLFPLSVSEGSLYRNTVETPIASGQYQALVAGIFVIISSLKKGTYRLSFYGRGVGKYLTKSVYDIEVVEGKESIRDISDKENGIRGERDLMDFVANWKDKLATKVDKDTMTAE